MDILRFEMHGRSFVHNDRKWTVCTNRHPTTCGRAWGWIEGPSSDLTWGNDGRFDSKAANDVVKAHNAWLAEQEPPALRLARLTPEIAIRRAEIERREQALDALRAELARLEGEAASAASLMQKGGPR